MKEVLSLCTFGILALCFVVFLTVFKPSAISAVSAPMSASVSLLGTKPTSVLVVSLLKFVAP